MTEANLEYYEACRAAASGSKKTETIYYDAVTSAAWWDHIEYIADFVKRQLVWAVSDFADKTGNPVVTSERYKKCLDRVEGI